MANVYHGSSINFDIAKPSPTGRSHFDKKKKKYIIDYEGISLHVTPYKWIALAYMNDKKQHFIHKGHKYKFSMGVSVRKKDSYFKNKRITILGKKSLEYSLKKIYGNGGYLYIFDKNNFKWVKGLGENELLSYDEQVPKKRLYIKFPIEEMKKMGVTFEFIDLTKINMLF
jgi:hypothetical protein